MSMNDKFRFARIGKTAHVFGMDSGTGVVSGVSLCGEKRRLTGNVYDRPLAKTKLCGVCMEKGMKLAEKGDEERAKKSKTDLAKYGVHLNDFWETEKGTKFEVIRIEDGGVEVRSEHRPYPSTYAFPLSPVVFHKRLWSACCGRQRPKMEAPKPAPSDLDYPQDPLERLAERDYDRIKAEEAKSLGKAKAAEAKPKAQVGVLDGDIWAMDEGTKLIVIRVHQEVAFCQFLGSKTHLIIDLRDGHSFDKLLERNGRVVIPDKPAEDYRVEEVSDSGAGLYVHVADQGTAPCAIGRGRDGWVILYYAYSQVEADTIVNLLRRGTAICDESRVMPDRIGRFPTHVVLKKTKGN